MANFYDISIALAGVCQAAQLVQTTAHKGSVERDILKTSLNSLLVTQPDSALDVFGNQLTNLKVGLETGLAQFGGATSAHAGKLDTEIGRYWISMLALSQKLNKNPQAKAELAKRLQQIERQLPLYDNDICAEQMISNLASIYSDVLSPLGTKIMVFGPQENLHRPDVQNRIRAALLAGVRAGILWQQVGGSRWQFFFSRRKILNQIQALYRSIY